MTITLISKAQFDTITEIQKKHSILTYQNTGYDNFDKSKMTEDDKTAFNEVQAILAVAIGGFSRLQNFKLSGKTKEIEIRFQYNYSYDTNDGGLPFIGVGYTRLTELLNGFEGASEEPDGRSVDLN